LLIPPSNLAASSTDTSASIPFTPCAKAQQKDALDSNQKPVYCNGRVKQQTRQLRKKSVDIGKSAKRHITLSGLKPRDMARWANLNVIDWLNQAKSASIRRVLEIIELAQQAQRIAGAARRVVTDEQYFSLKVQAGAVLSKLNAVLFRYNCTAKIVFYGASLHRQYLFSDRIRDLSETRAVAFLIENLPVVHRVRRCLECERWFFGITEHQKYCGDNCRKRHAAHGLEFLAQRRLYMRGYRQKQKAADMRAKKLVRRGN
jgi:hypothetical protein